MSTYLSQRPDASSQPHPAMLIMYQKQNGAAADGSSVMDRPGETMLFMIKPGSLRNQDYNDLTKMFAEINPDTDAKTGLKIQGRCVESRSLQNDWGYTYSGPDGKTISNVPLMHQLLDAIDVTAEDGLRHKDLFAQERKFMPVTSIASKEGPIDAFGLNRVDLHNIARLNTGTYFHFVHLRRVNMSTTVTGSPVSPTALFAAA